MSLKRIALIFIPCSFVLLGVTAYLKLCVIGWEEKFVAYGGIQLELATMEDAQVMSEMEESFTTNSGATIELGSGYFKDPAWVQAGGYPVRLSLIGRGVTARGFLRLKPFQVEYEAESEKEELIEKIRTLAQTQGVKEPISILEISTPTEAVTKYD